MSRARLRAASGILFPWLALLLAACASPPPAAPGPSPTLHLEPDPTLASGRLEREVPLRLRVDNPGELPLVLESLDLVLAVDGREAGRLSREPGIAVGPGSSLSLSLAMPVSLTEEDGGPASPDAPAELPYRLDARALLRDPGGRAREAATGAAGTLPLVREPRIEIRSIRIMRDLLVTTSLALILEIGNPNVFPVTFRSIDYRFHGEGRVWASGRAGEALVVGPRGSAELEIGFEMNFADMDRRLFDLVAKLRRVGFRLEGTALVATGLAFLPEFRVAFDRQGSCPVER